MGAEAEGTEPMLILTLAFCGAVDAFCVGSARTLVASCARAAAALFITYEKNQSKIRYRHEYR